jgi:hypothetical protein
MLSPTALDELINHLREFTEFCPLEKQTELKVGMMVLRWMIPQLDTPHAFSKIAGVKLCFRCKQLVFPVDFDEHPCGVEYLSKLD